MAKPGNLSNTSLNPGEAFGLAQGATFDGFSCVAIELKATVALNPGDAVVQDFATGINQVTKVAANDSTARYGIALNAAGIGAAVWVAIIGFCEAISGAAIAAGAAIATSANAAGQVKTAAAAGGRTNLGWALGAPGGAGVVFPVQMDKS